MCFTLNCDDPPTIGCEALADWTGIGWALCDQCHEKLHDGKMGFMVRIVFGPWPIGFYLWLLGGQGVLCDIDIVDMEQEIEADFQAQITKLQEWLKEN